MKTVPISESFGSMIYHESETNVCNLDKEEIIKLFKSSGFLLIRGFDIDTEQFKKFTASLSTEFMPYIGGAYNQREAINGDKTVLSVTGANLRYAVPLHGEMYYTKNKPSLLWFYCATPPLSGGETTVCDGIQVYQKLSDSTKELFHTKRLKYIRSYPKFMWQEIYKTDDLNIVKRICQENDTYLKVDEKDHSITTEFVTYAITESGKHKAFINNILPVIAQEYVQGLQSSIVRFEDGLKIPDDVIFELKDVTDKLTLPIAWQKGDILMIDNTRLLHGRKSFSDNQREIYVRMGHLANSAYN